MSSMKKLSLTLFTLTLSLFANAQPITKDETEVFDKWIKNQCVFKDQNLDNYLKKTEPSTLKSQLVTTYNKERYNLDPLKNCIATFFENTLDKEVNTKKLSKLHKTFENNIHDFLRMLANDGLNSECVKNRDSLRTKSKAIAHILDTYKALAQMIFPHETSVKQNEILFTVAHKMFDWCFGEEHFRDYQKLYYDENSHPLLRFLHATMWQHLVGYGWKNWHEGCLKNLQDKAAEGSEIIYIAGGNDVYQLLKSGIYTVKVIDPMLVQQDQYYAKNWEWLLQGEMGDIITLNIPNKKLRLRRVSYQEGEPFMRIKMSDGKNHVIKKSVTTWQVLDQNEEKLGTITFDRRNAETKDFFPKPYQTLLIAHDELIYASLPDVLHGWGIDPLSFDKDLKIYVKQLSHPVGPQTMCHLRLAEMMNTADLHFIRLSSNPN